MRQRAAMLVAAISLLVILFQASVSAVEDPSYVLLPWQYGAIAWVGNLPDDPQTFSRTLAIAVEDVFALWELPPPSPMLEWEDPSQIEPAWKTGQLGPIPQVLKKNPETNQLWRLNPLSWEGIEIYSLLYIAFPNRILLAQAFGDALVQGVWIPGSAARSGSEVWLLALTGVPMSIAAPAVDGMLVAWHELAHWMTYLVCVRDAVSWPNLPLFLTEGIAVYTSTSLVGVTNRQQRFHANWAKENALTVELDLSASYFIGLSVVTYLVETLGPSSFLDSLSQWAEDPETMISNIESGWRIWLGVD